MTYLPTTAKLTNPTHKVVGPDGTDLFLIRLKGARLRIKILFDAAWVKAGQVSEGWGPSGAEAVLMGRWIGPLRHHFGAIINSLPDGTHCVEVGPRDASLYDYQTDIVFSGPTPNNVSLRRAGFNVGRFGLNGLPVTRPQIAETRTVLEAHKAALIDGTFRREDGPMIPNPAPVDDGIAYRPTYVRGEGTTVPDHLLAEFIADADGLLAYCDFLDTLAPMPERPRTGPASAEQLAHLRQTAHLQRGVNLRAYLLSVLATGINDPGAYDEAQLADTRAHNEAFAAAARAKKAYAAA